MLLTEICLQTSDLTSLKIFYGNLLGLRIEERAGHFIIHTEQSRLVFEQATDSEKPFYHFAINIPYNKVNESLNWLKDKAEPLWLEDYQGTIAEFINWQARSVYFTDPAGNIVELIGRKELGDISHEPFSPDQFRCISEIGLVFPKHKFHEHVESLQNRFGLTFFSRQPPLDEFKVIGDDHGLLICVPEGRSWYPQENKPAGIYPLDIKMEVNGKMIELTF